MPDLLAPFQTGIVFFLALLLLIALSNWLVLRPLQSYPAGRAQPRVSILVPARNEALNLAACLRSLLAQDYADFEVLLLDDNSTDATGDIARAWAARDGRLRVMPGRPLPDGWLGKHWACHQLAEAARGDLWLFVDADTVHHPHALRDGVAALQAENADLISGLPRQDMRSWGERLVVSILPWSLFCFYPLALAQRLRWPPLVVAVGQYMLFRRAAYERIGGHAAVRLHVTDDIALAQRLVALGGRWRLVDAGERVTCRMYRGFGPAVEGFSKNLFGAFGYNLLAFAAIWLWIGLVFLGPPVWLALLAGGLGPPAAHGSAAPALAAMGLALALWAVCAWRLRLPLVVCLTYPVSVALAVAIAARSLALSLSGRAMWKGRALAAR